MASAPLSVGFGGGVNSAALLVGLHERGIRPDAITFADTGGEKPETYRFVYEVIGPWVAKVGFPLIVVVSRADWPEHHRTGDKTLEEECLRLEKLPSRAHGYGTCALKWKIDPQQWWHEAWEPARLAWAAGAKVRRALGYDGGEERRASIEEDERYTYWYPLIEWGWDRAACVAALERAGLLVPPKSACFYCPSSKKQEILRLAPALQDRAVAMESRAAASGKWEIAGLGRHFAWGRLIASDKAQQRLFPEAPAEECLMCSDGDPEEYG